MRIVEYKKEVHLDNPTWGRIIFTLQNGKVMKLDLDINDYTAICTVLSEGSAAYNPHTKKFYTSRIRMPFITDDDDHDIEAELININAED